MDTLGSFPDERANQSAALRVLIVEDVPTVAAAIDAALRQAGMDTRVAATGAQAVAAKAEFRPDVALVDLRLGTASGLELIPALRSPASSRKLWPRMHA